MNFGKAYETGWKTNNGQAIGTVPGAEKTSAGGPVVVIDDDDDVQNADQSLDIFSPMDSSICLPEEDYPIDIKINWKSKDLIRLQLKNNDSFEKIFQHFADMEGVTADEIIITRGKQRINKTDTPQSINLLVIDFLDGGVLSPDNVPKADVETEEKVICKIKVQTSSKQKITIDLKEGETFAKVIAACVEELKIPASKMKLSFDGDPISPDDTPESLDLEQEACIDLRLL